MSASHLESRLGVFSSLDSVMKSQDAASMNTVKIALAEQKDEVDANIQGQVIEMLRTIRPDQGLPAITGKETNHVDADKLIEASFTEVAVEINDDEISTIE